MNILSALLSVFQPKDPSLITVTEIFSSFKVEYDTVTKTIGNESLNDFLTKISPTDSFLLSLNVGEIPINFDGKNKSINDFVNDFTAEAKYLDNQEIRLEFVVGKKINNGIRQIYDYNSFSKFWTETPPQQLLQTLRLNFETSNFLSFFYNEGNKEIIQTANIYFGYGKEIVSNQIFKCQQIKENCHFSNYEEYPFDPNCFHLLTIPEKGNIISKKFDQFKLLFCICGIFDITTIKDNKLYYKINGFKTLEGTIAIDELDVISANNYIQIYNWIYLDKGNIHDKIGLTRNILTLYLKENSIEIPEETFSSIQSGYKVYLKENVSKYIELRNKINDELSWISQKSSEIIEKHLGNYQKSIFTFLSFFVSVFVIRVLQTGNFDNVFTKDPTILSFAFLGASVIFLIFSIWNLNKEKERLKRKYENIKSRFSDLLIKSDIERILRNDEEFNYEIEFIKARRNEYTLLWVITILILLTAVLLLSDYVNFSMIF
jgi:hypothetical protein